VRYDAVSLFNDSGNSTPYLRQLANQGIVFSKTYSTWDSTATSHFSILTGLRDGLNTDVDTPYISMAHILRTLGYDTFGISANRVVSQRSLKCVQPFHNFVDLSEYFEHICKDPEQLKLATKKIKTKLSLYNTPNTYYTRYKVFSSADVVLNILRTNLKKLKNPSFIFLNFMDAHFPYLPTAEFYDSSEEPFLIDFYSDIRNRYLPNWRYNHNLINEKIFDSELKVKHDSIEKVKEKLRGYAPYQVSIDLSPPQLRIYRKRYESEIKWLDFNIGRLVGILESSGHYRKSVIFITSDHGESFGEKDLVTHGFYNTGDLESTRRVPLIILPEIKDLKEPTVINETVNLNSIPRTVYDILGITGDFLQDNLKDKGNSLFPYIEKHFLKRQKTTILRQEPTQDRQDTTEELYNRLKSLGYID
jgi:arylsulfatase A-like enzyme